MSGAFITILNMSITASFVALAVMLVRLPLKKAPKVFSYALWGVVLFRLVCPFSIESGFSFMPAPASVIPQDIVYSQTPSVQTGIGFVDAPVNTAINNALPPINTENISNNNIGINPEYNAPVRPEAETLIAPESQTPVNTESGISPIHAFFNIAGYVWLFGFASLLIYAAIGYMRLKRRVDDALLVHGNVYETDKIKTAFVLGFIRPKIYIPIGIESAQQDYILTHEQTHIRRLDYLIKPFAFIVFALHWFNPIMWAAYFLMSKDIEMSCDEAVLRKTIDDIRGDYSTSLLNLSVKRGHLLTPLAFGESNVRTRVKNILNFKKPSRVIVSVALVLVVVLSAGFAVNSRNDTAPPVEPPSVTVIAGDTEIDWAVGLVKWDGIAYDRLNEFPLLMNGKTIDDLVYVRNFDTISLIFEGKMPRNTKLTEFILREDGGYKYNIGGMDYEKGSLTMTDTFSMLYTNKYTFTFAIEPNYATYLSSFSGDYEPGNTIKGYHFTCTWDGNECEYVFIVRGDAGITMTNSTDYEPQSLDPAPTDMLNGRRMTLDDVRGLAAKGDGLLFEDMRQYQGVNHSTIPGRYIVVFDVEGGYRLLAHSNLSGKPDAVYFESIWEYRGNGIDIRYEEIEAYLRSNPSQEYVTEEQALNYLTDLNYYIWGTNPVPTHGSLGTSFEPGEECWLFKTAYILETDGDISYGNPRWAVGKHSGSIYYTNDDDVTWYRYSSSIGVSRKPEMTLADVRGLAVMGEAVTEADLEPFQMQPVMTGIYYATYLVDGGQYSLSFIWKVENGLTLTRAGDWELDGVRPGIDIRYYDVDKYIADGTRELVRPLPESPLPVLEVLTSPPRYTPAMSSMPGMLISPLYSGHYTDVRYRAEHGSFITLVDSSDYNVSNMVQLGSDVTVSAETLVYWTPWIRDGELCGDDFVTVTIIDGVRALAETVLSVQKESDESFVWSAFVGTKLHVQIRPDVGTFSYYEHLSMYNAGEPGVQTDGFNNTERMDVPNKEIAIALAKNEVSSNSDYDTIAVSRDDESQIWMVTFFAEGLVGGGQSVYMSGDGRTTLIVFGE